MGFKRNFGKYSKYAKGAALMVAGRTARVAAGVGARVLTGQSLSSAIHSQVVRELSSIAGRGDYKTTKRGTRQRRTIRGRGDYELSGAPGSLMNPRTAFEPRMKNEVGIVEISRSEYLGDVFSAASGTPSIFNLQSFLVNPGLDISLGGASAWLAPIGSAFQQYRYKQLVFEFRTTSGASVASANTSLGTIIMAANYDSSRPNYTNKQQMMDSQFAVSAAPDKSIMFPVECKNKLEALKLWDIRTGALLPNQSQNTYDFVNFQIATQGMQATSVNLGELWVHYTVCLEKTSTTSSNSLIQTANYRNFGPAGANITPGCPLGIGGPGGVLYPSPYSNLPLTFSYAGNANSIIFPPYVSSGNYLVVITWAANAAGAWTNLDFAGFNNCTIDSCLFDPLSPVSGGQTGYINDNNQTTPTSARLAASFILVISGYNASVTFGSNFTPPTGRATDVAVMVTQLNSSASQAGY